MVSTCPSPFLWVPFVPRYDYYEVYLSPLGASPRHPEPHARENQDPMSLWLLLRVLLNLGMKSRGLENSVSHRQKYLS